MKPTNYFNEEYNYKPDTDEPELVNCVLCDEDEEIKFSEKFAGHWVCSECVEWHKRNKESVIESVMKWKKLNEKAKAYTRDIQERIDMRDFANELLRDIHTITKDYKP